MDTRRVEDLYHRAGVLAIREVEKEARRILKSDPDLNEFVMAMGAAFFTDKNGDNHQLQDIDAAEELRDFILEWDEYLRITGVPMRFTADGDKITDW